jgi:hypothetical protein
MVEALGFEEGIKAVFLRMRGPFFKIVEEFGLG